MILCSIRPIDQASYCFTSPTRDQWMSFLAFHIYHKDTRFRNKSWSVWLVHNAVAAEIKTATLIFEEKSLLVQKRENGEQGQKDDEQVQQQINEAITMSAGMSHGNASGGQRQNFHLAAQEGSSMPVSPTETEPCTPCRMVKRKCATCFPCSATSGTKSRHAGHKRYMACELLKWATAASMVHVQR